MTGAVPSSGASLAGGARFFYLRIAAVVFLACALVTGGHLQSPDDELLYRLSESMALRGSLAVQPIEYDEASGTLLVPPSQTFATVAIKRGEGNYEFQVQYLPLQAALAMPLVWLGKASEGAFAEGFYRTLRRTPTNFVESPVKAWRRAVVVVFFNPLVTTLTALVIARIVMTLTGRNRRAAAWTALLWALGTIAMPHSRTFFTEPLAGLCALVALDQLIRWYGTPLRAEFASRRLKQMIVLGGALGAAIWTRMDSPLMAFGIGIALVVLGELKRRRENAYGDSDGRWPFRDYAIAGALTVGAFIGLVAFNHWRFGAQGQLLGGGYGDQSEGVKLSTPLLVGLHGLLASPGKGLFFFSPALVLGVWGWLRAPRHLRWLAPTMAIAYLPFALAMTKWQNWEGGWCWGPRHIVALHAPIMIGAAFLFTGCENLARRVAIKVVAVVSLLVQLFGSTEAPMEFYHEFFRTPDDGLYFRTAYRETEYGTVMQDFAVMLRDPDTGKMTAQELPPGILPAPMIDSLYLPQHTQWAGYPEMWRDGKWDWWLISQLAPESPDGLQSKDD